MTPTEACIALNMVPNIGPVRMRRLLERFETPQRILAAKGADLRQVQGVGAEVVECILGWESSVDLSGELARIAEFGAHVITQADATYPRSLREIHNPPIVLYVWGTLTERDHRAIGVVGSRKTTHYGTDCARRLAYQLAYAGFTVVSGLARGIDTAGHMGALAAQGRTVAVIGSGLMELYPPENADLAEKISANGAVVSEYPMKLSPTTQTFPYRNRIISGWGDGLLVVEAGAKSGALIAAQHALEQGRPVYAVPGPIDRPTSHGCNRLIQQGAKLVMSANDMLDDLQALFPEARRAPENIPDDAEWPLKSAPVLSEKETAILAALGGDTLSLDDLVGKTNLPISALTSTLLALEMKRLVKPQPGQLFRKS